MFDVDWIDPGRETVGQRRNRKDQEANGLSRASSIKSSKSSDSTPSQPQPPIFGFFGSKKKSLLKRAASNSKLPAQGTEQNNTASRRLSTYTAVSEFSVAERPKTAATTTGRNSDDAQNADVFFSGPLYNSGSDRSDYSDESVFSGWTGRSTATESTWGSVSAPSTKSISGKSKIRSHIVQKLSQDSIVTQSTEITVSSSDNYTDAERTQTIIRISAPSSHSVEENDRRPSSTPVSPRSPAFSTFDFPIPKLTLADRHFPAVPEESLAESSEDPKVLIQPTGWPMNARGRRADTWQPPEAWEVSSGDVPIGLPPLPPGPFRVTKEKRPSPPPSELIHLRKTIRRMRAASPKIVLERLKEEWDGIADASVYRELELEKQLWMLSALRSLNKDQEGEIESPVPPAGIAGSKALSLYENHASASFLSALSPCPEIHHLSPTPLYPKSYPNIHPLCVPGPTTTLPYASSIFSSISAFSLPSLLPASSLPPLLKECARIMLPSSPLHLTLLDPSPLPNTLGPRMRAWLESNLVLNLETQFRCLNPRRLFPIWLADAGLRGEGSVITNFRFYASVSPNCSPSIFVSDEDGDVIAQGAEEQEQEETEAGKEGRKDEETRMKLKSVVGRMLWREMWGAYVQGERWWWEDGEILEECKRMGTCWEYAVIEAVKE